MNTALVVTPFGDPKQLAAACVLSDIRGSVVPVGGFSAIVLDNASREHATEVTQKLSKMAGRYEVLLLVREDDAIASGHYRAGKRQSEVPAGLALQNLPEDVERLLLGQAEPADIEGAQHTADISKMQASALTMTGARAAIARTAIVWMIVAAAAFIALVIGAVVALSGPWYMWIATALAAGVFGFSLFCINKLLGRRQ